MYVSEYIIAEHLRSIASDVNKTLPVSFLGWIAVVPWKLVIYTHGALGLGTELLRVTDTTKRGSHSNSSPEVQVSAHREGGGKIRGVCWNVASA